MSNRNIPWLLKIPFWWAHRKEPLSFLLAKSTGIPKHKAGACEQRFRFKNDESDFVLSLLRKKKNFWLYRCDQQRFCGDFVLVDMSGTSPPQRHAYVIDLKSGADVKFGGGGASNQLVNANKVIESLIVEGILCEESQVSLVTGDRRKLLCHLFPTSFSLLR